MRRLALVLPLSILLAAVTPIPAAAEAAPPSDPPTLSGEQFRQCWYVGDESCTGSSDKRGITSRCNPDESGTVTFATEGAVSAGPYPGRFEAAGTATLGPGGEPTSLTEDFVIDSPNGHVVGTKTLASGGFGACGSDYAVFANATARYTAEILTPDGRLFRDRGSASIHIYHNIHGTGSLFYQDFTSDFAHPQLVCKKDKDGVDKDKDKCKDKERAAETRLPPP